MMSMKCLLIAALCMGACNSPEDIEATDQLAAYGKPAPKPPAGSTQGPIVSTPCADGCCACDDGDRQSCAVAGYLLYTMGSLGPLSDADVLSLLFFWLNYCECPNSSSCFGSRS